MRCWERLLACALFVTHTVSHQTFVERCSAKPRACHGSGEPFFNNVTRWRMTSRESESCTLKRAGLSVSYPGTEQHCRYPHAVTKPDNFSAVIGLVRAVDLIVQLQTQGCGQTLLEFARFEFHQ